MTDEIKAVVALTVKKYLLIGAAILMGCLLIGVGIITVIAGNEEEFKQTYENDKLNNSSQYMVGDTKQIEGMDLYNADKTVNEEAIQALENLMSTEYLDLTGPGPGHEDYSRVADWLQDGLIFQCPWWAVGRANYFLDIIGSDKWVAGPDAKNIITNTNNVENFETGMEARANSLICWDGGQYGHVGYVEAVGSDGTIYVSACSNGETWDGIFALTADSGYHYSDTYQLQGFIYLTDEEYSTQPTQTTEFGITMLINEYNALPEATYGKTAGDPSYLVEIEDEDDYEAHSEAASQYKKMKSAAEAAGCNIWVCSAYRSYATQDNKYELNEGNIKEYQGPLTSEHRTGLALDFGVVEPETDWDSWLAEEDQKKWFNWLYQNAHNYGFILRYPKGAETKTGIVAEPWHYRYIGVEHAKKFKELSKAYEKTTNGITYSTYTYEEYHQKTFNTGTYKAFSN